MPNNIPESDPKTIWQKQPTESSTMILEKMVRQKVRSLHLKTGRALLGNLALVIMLAVSCTFGIKVLPASRVAFVFVLAWSVVGLYFLSRRMWSAAMPGDAALCTGLEFYRQEIVRRRGLLQRVFLWAFCPTVLAAAAFLFAVSKMGQFQNARPVTILFLIWIVAFFVIRMREHRDLRRELDLLKEMEGLNSK